jgi:prepilin-type N-terminal cleavage/methylation domain-containing protein/prepilin-type processing-associated H-X9-DG protein
MKRLPRSHKRGLHSFTLVELLVVMAIIALLVALTQPALESAIINAKSVKCATNLRSIGAAVIMYTGDHDNALPQIDQAALPIYTPTGQGIVAVLGSYGISSNITVCPIDADRGTAADCNNTTYPNPGSSYEWDPVFDDEPANATSIYIRPGGTNTVARPVTPSRVRLAMDFSPLHHNKSNIVFLDGHVVRH